MSDKDFFRLLKTLEENGDRKARNEALRARCRNDLELFAVVFFPHYCTRPFNEYHEEYFQSVEFGERDIRRARAAPRGSGKSTLPALIKVLHDVCYGLEKFIVILSATKNQAGDKLKDIRSEVFNNDLLVEVFNLRFTTKKPAETHYILAAGEHRCKLQAFGSGSQIRGIRFGSKRPTKVILDDAEDSEEVLNEEVREKKTNWYFEDVSEIGDEGTNIEFVGTILHPDSLLQKILQNPAYDGKKFRAVIKWSDRQDLWNRWEQIYMDIENPDRVKDAEKFYSKNQKAMTQGTQVLWPEKEDYLSLMKQKVEKGHRSFMKEKQNEPLGAEDAVFTRIKWYREVDGGILIEENDSFFSWDQLSGALGAMDPSTGQNKPKKGKKGDFCSILTGYTDPRGRLLVHSDWMERKPPSDQIKQIFDHHDRYRYDKFGFESNLYRELLRSNILEERKVREKKLRRKINIRFWEIDNTENKIERITTLEPKITHGWILFNRALGKEFMNQLTEFPKWDYDDGPDALEMLWRVANKGLNRGAVSVNVHRGR